MNLTTPQIWCIKIYSAMKLYKLLIFLVGLAILSCKSDPCATKSGFLESFEKFNSEFEDQKAELEEESLVEYEDRFKSLVNGCYKKFKADMSLEERQDFWESSLSFYLSRYDGKLTADLGDKMDDPFFKYMKAEVMELIKESGAMYLFSLQKVFKNELPRLMEIFSSELENFGEELMDVFN